MRANHLLCPNFFRLFLVIFLFITSFSAIKAQNYYDLQWKKIEEASKKGQVKSNLPLILELQNHAMKDQNLPEIIKSLKEEMSILQASEDDAQNNEISTFYAKLNRIGEDLKGTKQLLYRVFLTRFFTEYYGDNFYEINERIQLNNQNVAAIETWTRLDYKTYLTKYFTDLEKEKNILEKIELKPYQKLFSDFEFPTYFINANDWFSIEYIDFLQDTNLFTPNELKANQAKVLFLYDVLISSHQGNPKLYFQHQKLKTECDFTHCQDQLTQLQNLYQSSEEGDYKVVIAAEIARLLRQKEDEKKALDFLAQAKKKYPKSEFLNGLLNIENEIRQKVLNLSFETYPQSKQPIQIVAEAKNLTKFNVNIYKTTDYNSFLNYIADSYTTKYSSIKKSLVKKIEFELPKMEDFKMHKTALVVDALPSGIYMLETVIGKEVQNQYYMIATDARALVSQMLSVNEPEVLKWANRENGQILPSRDLKIYQVVSGKKMLTTVLKTDKNGVFKLPETDTKSYYRTYLIEDSDHHIQIIRKYGNKESQIVTQSQPQYLAQVFLDRAIYRPGQTVYFKVITTGVDKSQEQVVSGLQEKITLMDANGQELSTQNFQTNLFGSYSGQFVLPKGKLNGLFSLKIKGTQVETSKYFRVEEYKRPQFEVTLDPITGEYKYGGTLELKGKAASFSGVPLGDVAVNYEIKKQNIRWRYFWWLPKGNDLENSILGSVKTNAKGEFSIKVKLEKDETLSGVQVDQFVIRASVTDINGETQAAETNLKVASVSHYITAENLNRVFADQPIQLSVETKNYNDQVIRKPYHLKLEKLEIPERIFRSNFASAVQNTPILSKKEFISKFPHDRFDRSEEILHWKVTEIISEKLLNNAVTEKLILGKLNPGTYRLTLFNVEGKDSIKTERVFSVWDKSQLSKEQFPFLEVLSPKEKVHQGEKVKVYIYSAIPDALVHVFKQIGDGHTETENHFIKNGVLMYETEVPKGKNLERLNLQFQIAAYNDIQTQSVDLKIIDDKVPLRIEMLTFRDKLEPGAKEKWSIKVSGNKNEKVIAEVLANMYDQALDQFAKNQYTWEKIKRNPAIFSQYNINENLRGSYYSEKIPYLPLKIVTTPEFSWLNEARSVSFYSAAYDAMPAPVRMAKKEMAPAAMGYVSEKLAADSTITDREIKEDLQKVPIRQNLNETAFFYPELKTDANGLVSFEFTSPEALTQWKLMFLAHTQDARAAILEKEVITQKEFSITPNYPRFLREGDELVFQSKINNLTHQILNGSAQLQVLDAFTNQDISSMFGEASLQHNFQVDRQASGMIQWKIKVPQQFSSIILKVVAKAGDFSDGEQKAIAVLPNRILITDTQPIFVKEGESKTFILESLKNSNSSSVVNFSNTLELTTNPIWEVMFALPTLKSDPNSSADTVFNRWFADVLAAEIFKANPKLKTVFDEYQEKGLLKSNLEKNQELKQILLDETPWVLENQSQTQQMEKIARLFDANTMRNSIQNDWQDLKRLQNPDGGFSWYPGYPSSYTTSLYILKNWGRIDQWLKHQTLTYQDEDQKEMLAQLIRFIDGEVNHYWDAKKENVWTNFTLDYLDSRQYFEQDFPLKNVGLQLKNAVFKKAAKADLKEFTFYGLHRAALLFDHYGLKNVSEKLLTYLKETSTQTKTQGTYWKNNVNNWGWYALKITNQAGALEAFSNLKPADLSFIEDLKIWLTTQKEVNAWPTSRGTAEVIFTMLNSGTSWTSPESEKVEIKWGGKEVQPETKATGYVKQTVLNTRVDKNLAEVKINKPGPGMVQGGVFWQYYEEVNKIKSSESYISITKELYKKVKTENGEELVKITEKTPLKIGDKVSVRMMMNTDRDMEFIHLKDMRAAGFEPVNVLSGYQWKNNLGYYQTTKDASTNFYIEYMPKGKYVFEYDYLCNAAGSFSNGITTLQNYYAPQMNAHSEGGMVTIEE